MNSMHAGESALRELICEIGRRLYARGLVAGNDGNLSIRLDAGRVLCTPTLMSKGFMSPDDLCIVDLAGEQLAGRRKLTSEIRLHLEIYRGDAAAGAVVHCHAPHATAFAIANEPIPSGISPEMEVFIGQVPMSDYMTPGTAEFAATICPFLGTANTVVLANHGIVCWAAELERAYWQAEILDQYCRMLILSRLIGGPRRLAPEAMQALLDARGAYGMPPDARASGGAPLFQNLQF
ncbi:MAG: class II aldolase/adducin family protein [Phycisphaerales bacterium]|nr:class II aldolase/adducin family protein [Phycisphaerales bacterium]